MEKRGFDEKFRMASGEDPDLSFRLAGQGIKMVFAPKAIVAHYHPSSLWKYWKTKFYRAYWRVLLYKKHPAKTMRDSYTNPNLTWQIISFGVGAISALIAFFGFVLFSTILWSAVLVFLIGMLISLFFMLPTIFFISKKNLLIGIASVGIFMGNNIAFILGFLKGQWDLRHF